MCILNIMTGNRTRFCLRMNETLSNSSYVHRGRVELEERRDAGKDERSKAGFALPSPLIYERVANLKIP